MGIDMHAGRVPPKKERLVRFCLPLHEIECARCELLVDCLHTLTSEWPGIFDSSVRERLDDTARPELPFELWILRIVLMFRLFFGVEMIQVPEKLIEAVVRRQMLVQIAQMILAELPSGIAMRLEKFCDRASFRVKISINELH